MSTTTTQRPVAATTGTAWVLSLCLIVAILEGVDLQSTGVAAPRMAHEFGLSVTQMGLAFSAGMFGLLPGAMIGGRLADRIGRKRVLLLSMVVFGMFSILTALVWSFPSLLVARVLTGLGLGGAMPNLIALSAEAVAPRRRNTAVSIMYCGMPLGGALAAFIGVLSAGDTAWRHIFYAGGIGPLIVVPLLLLWLPESRAFETESAVARGTAVEPKPTLAVLFGEGRAAATIEIWISYFCTLIVLYFLLNWLPSLIVSRGLSHAQAGVTQIFFNAGSVIGVLALGLLMDRYKPRAIVTIVYVGIVASLIALSGAMTMGALSVSVLFAGMCVVGAQAVLYALAAACYRTEFRGTGVGAAVAVGRLGSIVGPLAAAQLLAIGKSASMVIGASVPVTVVALVTAWLAVRHARAD
ncbi:3-(3-hydroxy-phenyl)propionate transporter MhpT [Pararobbsia silviterrae]|uniref:3-(3-hydroxy-phenyl)propionate transporter MhpT n=1 Tax=Pararobbsia silviterrae TaxID=1792498 RepID=A0A494XIZ5_9BURK|nr:3-(3-hydroxy-phenyl)propionate transporter MhpT [Pararobbsia silviterrae]RKP49691.1 3-(3-hydroxy-phenyl)propionate transporter MhpT [Pararobbsia silviterrae]